MENYLFYTSDFGSLSSLQALYSKKPSDVNIFWSANDISYTELKNSGTDIISRYPDNYLKVDQEKKLKRLLLDLAKIINIRKNY